MSTGHDVMAASPTIRLLVVTLAAATLIACGSDATGPAFGPPARVQILSGQQIQGVVATALSQPLRVHVSDDRGRNVPGVPVHWQVTVGGGQLTAVTAVTDSAGRAEAQWTLGTTAGEQTLDARAASLPAVRFTAQASAGPVDRINISSDSILFTALGDTALVDAQTEDAYGNNANVPITWSSSNAAVVAVSSGRITALGNGTAMVTASAGERTRTVQVRVTQFAASVRVLAFADTINALTHMRQLALNASDRNGRPLAALRPSWSSLDAGIATVDSTGLVRAITPGWARIRVAIEGAADTVRVYVRQKVAAVTLTPADGNLTVGAQLALSALAADSAGVPIATPAFVWQSSSGNVATVDANGRVTALAAGTTVISAIAAADTTRRGTTVMQVIQTPTAGGCTGNGSINLDLPLGGSVRRSASDNDALRCLWFDVERASGQQYLVLFENMTRTGGYSDALFPGPTVSNAFSITIDATGPVASSPALNPEANLRALPPDMAQSWDFGNGPIYEAAVRAPGAASEAKLLRADGQLVALESVVAPVVGDTVVVYMEGIPRLGIASGNQRAVIRFISNDLMIAEDVRLQTTLRRQNGMFNTPLSQQTMAAIAAEYAAYAKVQGDALFAGRHNATVESTPPPRVLAIHSLLYADNVWGYTYSYSNYFVWDYWVLTDGSTPGASQMAQVVTDNLFMHEIAHMRHWGLAERAGNLGGRGNQWLVEGFARFSERLPIAARLLGTQTPSRTNNLVLPMNPAFNGGYYRNDVPTFLTAGSTAFTGYDNSSFVFDYLADQTTLAGRDPLAALRDLVVSAGTVSDADAAVGRWLPGVTLGDLFTRARVALYADDNGVAHAAPATQYLQFRLRASRPAGSANPIDPINLWPKIQPGTTYTQTRVIANGSAWGYLIDGSTTMSSAAIRINATSAVSGVISITRVR